MNIGMLLLILIGGFAGLFSTLYICISLPIYHYMEDLSPGCKRHPDYEIAVLFNILIPNKNGAVKKA